MNNMNNKKNKKRILSIILVTALVILIIVGGINLYLWLKKTPQEKAAVVISESVQKAAAGVLPENIVPSSNPLEKLPEINPVEKSNPFKDIYRNPFE